MHLCLLTVGSRGDVQPFAALALELSRRGHTVTLAAPTDLRGLVERFGVSFAPLRADYLELASSPQGQAAVRGDPRAALRLMREVVRPGARQLLQDAHAAAAGADALVFHPKALAGRHLAEWLGVPAWVFAPAPLLVPTRTFAAAGTATASLGPLNRLTYALAPLAEAPLRAEIRAWRESLGLSSDFSSNPRRAGTRTLPVLHAYSRLLSPAPADWDAGAHVTGFWTLSPEAEPPLSPEVTAFLDAGPPPVSVGFGSMGVRDGGHLARQVAGALRRVGRRGVLLGLPPVDGDDMLSVPGAPHGRLFPRVAATVHHGGAGTTAAGLRAGVPALPVPHGLDQPFWAARVREAGVGVGLPLKRLNTDTLGTALKTVLEPEVQRCASVLETLLRAENGAARAADLILQD